ncbi:MAG: CCA tRNA nucleotidyltransferase [Candidatus Aenigmatarchaeota archaeon]
MPDYEKVLQKVLKKIKPKLTEKKELENLAKNSLELTKKLASKYQAKAILAGSVTRDTWLPDKKEFDIFILFPEELEEKKMEELGLEIGKKVIKKFKGKFKIEYAEHPYVSGSIKGIDVDIVPAYELKSLEKIKSAVDRTPFHVKYIEEHLSLEQSDQVRLLKQFVKAINAYGADAKTQGFSGYVCELLIIKYKNFIDALKAIVNWMPGEIIDLENFYEKKDYPQLRQKFRGQALIIIDPTDKNRNTSSALSSENFFKIKKHARQFLEKPSENFFFERKINPITEKEFIKNLKHRKTQILIIKFYPPKTVPDILWPQLRKFANRLKNILEETKYEFKVFGKDVYTNEKDFALVLLEMEIFELPFIQKRRGPLIFDLDDSKRFLEKHSKIAISGPYVEDNFWVAEVRRRFLTAKEKLIDTLNKDLDILKAKGIPELIAKEISKKGFKVIDDTREIIKLFKKEKGFGVFLRKYFEKESFV